MEKQWGHAGYRCLHQHVKGTASIKMREIDPSHVKETSSS